MAVDPLWDNVVLRLLFDGDLTDYSDSAHTVTTTSTVDFVAGHFAQAMRTGGTSGSSNTGASTPNGPDFQFGSGDFTVEFWLQRTGSGTHASALGTSDGAGSRGWSFGVTQAGNVALRVSSDGTAYAINETAIIAAPAGINHMVFERAGSVVRAYVNGSMVFKTTFSGSIANGGTSLQINRAELFNNRGTASLWDDLRITKGVARYNSDAGYTVPTEAQPTSGEAEPIEVEPGAGDLVVTGAAPLIIGQQIAEPSAGALVITGSAPGVVTTGEAYPLTGSLVITGQAPEIFNGIYALPSPGHLVVTSGAPEVLIFTEASALVSQTAVLAIAEPPPPPARISQQAVLGIGYVIPEVAVSQQAILVIAHGGPCVTSRCQIWTITRRDGRVFRYTSHDEDVQFGLETYKACHSLNPSASENASSLGSVGNIELVGIIDDDGISEADLYGGRFDDAYVTVDLIAWGSPVEAPRRLASGWTGQLSQGDTSFNMEVLGSSSRLEQQALTQPYAPGCRWIFGDSRCGVDVEAKKLAGQITSVASRARFGAELSGGPGAWQWANGRVRFLTGPNAGQVLEVKTVDFDTGLITLWPSAAMLPTAGDEFELLPGCDLAKDGGCSVYANVINFGGFPDVPGEDAMLETPNAQY